MAEPENVSLDDIPWDVVRAFRNEITISHCYCGPGQLGVFLVHHPPSGRQVPAVKFGETGAAAIALRERTIARLIRELWDAGVRPAPVVARKRLGKPRWLKTDGDGN